MKILATAFVAFFSVQTFADTLPTAWFDETYVVDEIAEEDPQQEDLNKDDFTFTPPATERAATLVTRAQARIGSYVGGRDCYAFVRSISNGNLGTVIGSFSGSNSSVTLSPGQIVHMQNFNLAGVSGSNHWAMIETVRSDGRITILHQNLGGSPLTRSAFRKTQMRGHFKIYQP
jgi:hypothetical protein